jgi:hypothetical protein
MWMVSGETQVDGEWRDIKFDYFTSEISFTKNSFLTPFLLRPVFSERLVRPRRSCCLPLPIYTYYYILY